MNSKTYKVVKMQEEEMSIKSAYGEAIYELYKHKLQYEKKAKPISKEEEKHYIDRITTLPTRKYQEVVDAI